MLDTTRISRTTPATASAAAQLRAVVPTLLQRPGVLADRGYSSARCVTAPKDVACDRLARSLSNRVLYGPPPPPTGRKGRERYHGTPLTCSDPTTQEQPDAVWSGTPGTGQPLGVAAWYTRHFRQERTVPVTVLRVERPTATGKKRDPAVVGICGGGWIPCPWIRSGHSTNAAIVSNTPFGL